MDLRMSMDNKDGMDMVFRDVHVNLGKVPILKGINGCVKKGEMLAILGPSGAGKSTLLNALSARIPLESGEIIVDQMALNKHLKRKISYVLQNDIFFPNLTLRKTLMFAAKLRMPEKMKFTDKMKRLDEIVAYLELDKCLDTLIGGQFIPGLSGGEKKRANIACELLSNPRILLLDEPTSGLDAVIAANMVNMLKRFAKDFCMTVIVTLHQPSSDMFHSFNKLLLVHEGQNAYFGRAQDVLGFFGNVGFTCSPHYNPADFILQSVKKSEACSDAILQAAQKQKYKDDWPEELKDKGQKYYLNNHTVKAKVMKESKWPTGFWRQYVTLSHRHILISTSAIISSVNFIKTLVISLFVGAFWFRTPWDEDHFSARSGMIYFSLAYWTFNAALQAMSVSERPTVAKERAAGLYRASAYYLAKMTSELPLIIVLPIIFMTIAYFMTSIKPSVLLYVGYTGIMMMNAVISQGYAIMVGIFIQDVAVGILMVYIIVLFSMMAGGFYLRKGPVLDLCKYISNFHYGFQSLLHLEYHGKPSLLCNPPNITDYDVCRVTTNTTNYLPTSVVLEKNDIAENIWPLILPLLAMVVIPRAIGYIGVRYYTFLAHQKPTSGSKQKGRFSSMNNGKVIPMNNVETPKVDIVTKF